MVSFGAVFIFAILFVALAFYVIFFHKGGI